MKSKTDYKPSQSFALMLIGPPKAGKTVFATTFPDPYILDCDNNLAGALRYHGDVFNFFYDNPNLDEAKKEKRWSFSIRALQEACSAPDVKTVIIDGLSLLADYLQEEILSHTTANALIVSGEKCMGLQQWAPFKIKLSQLITACKSSGKLFIMTCHEQAMTNDANAVIAYRPLVSSALRDNICGYFTDVWRCEAMDKPGKGPQYSVRFKPRSLMQIGNSLQIPEVEMNTTNLTRDQIWSKLSKYISA